MNRRLANVQLLRGVAALLVLQHHVVGRPWSFEFGLGGVDVFFVISGFIITTVGYDQF